SVQQVFADSTERSRSCTTTENCTEVLSTDRSQEYLRVGLLPVNISVSLGLFGGIHQRKRGLELRHAARATTSKDVWLLERRGRKLSHRTRVLVRHGN